MDLYNFILLTVGCTGGFIAISYNSIAIQKGWTIGSLFVNGEGINPSFLLTIAFIFQFGMPILSAFLNPWWSSLVVLFCVFIFYTLLCSIFKSKSQVLSILLMGISLVLTILQVL